MPHLITEYLIQSNKAKRFDENGDYVRKYVPELAHIKGIEVQEPWEAPDGYSKWLC